MQSSAVCKPQPTSSSIRWDSWRFRDCTSSRAAWTAASATCRVVSAASRACMRRRVSRCVACYAERLLCMVCEAQPGASCGGKASHARLQQSCSNSCGARPAQHGTAQRSTCSASSSCWVNTSARWEVLASLLDRASTSASPAPPSVAASCAAPCCSAPLVAASWRARACASSRAACAVVAASRWAASASCLACSHGGGEPAVNWRSSDREEASGWHKHAGGPASERACTPHYFTSNSPAVAHPPRQKVSYHTCSACSNW